MFQQLTAIRFSALNFLPSNLLTLFGRILIAFNLLSFTYSSYAHSKFIEHSGDALQIVNPLIALMISNDEKGLGHFGLTFGSAIASSVTLKGVGMLTKANTGRRPQRSENPNRRYDGFPSGHTTAAFAAASYIRHYGGKWKIASVPLYVTAAFTGFSRVHSKWHTKMQVAGGVILSEAVMYLTTKTSWSQNYQAIPIIWADNKGINAKITINF